MWFLSTKETALNDEVVAGRRRTGRSFPVEEEALLQREPSQQIHLTQDVL